MYDRVKYYPPTDFTCGMNLEKIESFYPTEPEDLIKDINDVIELYNIYLYLKNEIKLIKWTEEDYKKYKVYSNHLKSFSFEYFNSFNDNNILSSISFLNRDYNSNFWELFNYCKLYNKISRDVFFKLLKSQKSSITYVLKHKRIVNKYGKEIKTYLMKHERFAKIILDCDNANLKRNKLYMPDCITTEDKDAVLVEYINKPDPNPNYLKKIFETEIPIKATTKLKAKRKYDKIIEKYFKNNSGIAIEVKLEFVPNQKEDFIISQDGFTHEAKYSLDWILKNLDYPTLLNNFIYMFNFSDEQMRVTSVSKLSELDIFERDIFDHGHKNYNIGMIFKFKEIIANSQMILYCELLKKNGIKLEEVIEWFFKEYLEQEFRAPKFRLNMPSEDTSYSEKCNLIATNLESIIKQFFLFVNENEIDFELLQFIPSGVNYKDIPSLIERKYAYGDGENYKKAIFLLFSDQCMLSYIKRIGDTYNTFYELLKNEIININEYSERDQLNVRWLIEEGFLRKDSKGNLEINDYRKLKILYDLYYNEVINIQWQTENAINNIENMSDAGYIRFGSSLLAENEISLFNYYLNQAEFRNGLDLRNLYSHGIKQTEESEDVHKEHYYLLLRLMIYLVIKINDEFCLKDLLNINNI